MAEEYIKRSDAIKAVDNLCHVYFPANKANLEKIPAEDVAPVQKWIPVTERLPDNFERVLIASGINVDTGWYRARDNEWISEGYIGLVVTHWMPLPEPPKDGE